MADIVTEGARFGTLFKTAKRNKIPRVKATARSLAERAREEVNRASAHRSS
jgi:hypothetical protein